MIAFRVRAASSHPLVSALASASLIRPASAAAVIAGRVDEVRRPGTS